MFQKNRFDESLKLAAKYLKGAALAAFIALSMISCQKDNIIDPTPNPIETHVDASKVIDATKNATIIIDSLYIDLSKYNDKTPSTDVEIMSTKIANVKKDSVLIVNPINDISNKIKASTDKTDDDQLPILNQARNNYISAYENLFSDWNKFIEANSKFKVSEITGLVKASQNQADSVILTTDKKIVDEINRGNTTLKATAPAVMEDAFFTNLATLNKALVDTTAVLEAQKVAEQQSYDKLKTDKNVVLDPNLTINLEIILAKLQATIDTLNAHIKTYNTEITALQAEKIKIMVASFDNILKGYTATKDSIATTLTKIKVSLDAFQTQVTSGHKLNAQDNVKFSTNQSDLEKTSANLDSLIVHSEKYLVPAAKIVDTNSSNTVATTNANNLILAEKDLQNNKDLSKVDVAQLQAEVTNIKNKDKAIVATVSLSDLAKNIDLTGAKVSNDGTVLDLTGMSVDANNLATNVSKINAFIANLGKISSITNTKTPTLLVGVSGQTITAAQLNAMLANGTAKGVNVQAEKTAASVTFTNGSVTPANFLSFMNYSDNDAPSNQLQAANPYNNIATTTFKIDFGGGEVTTPTFFKILIKVNKINATNGTLSKLYLDGYSNTNQDPNTNVMQVEPLTASIYQNNYGAYVSAGKLTIDNTVSLNNTKLYPGGITLDALGNNVKGTDLTTCMGIIADLKAIGLSEAQINTAFANNSLSFDNSVNISNYIPTMINTPSDQQLGSGIPINNPNLGKFAPGVEALIDNLVANGQASKVSGSIISPSFEVKALARRDVFVIQSGVLQKLSDISTTSLGGIQDVCIINDGTTINLNLNCNTSTFVQNIAIDPTIPLTNFGQQGQPITLGGYFFANRANLYVNGDNGFGTATLLGSTAGFKLAGFSGNNSLDWGYETSTSAGLPNTTDPNNNIMISGNVQPATVNGVQGYNVLIVNHNKTVTSRAFFPLDFKNFINGKVAIPQNDTQSLPIAMLEKNKGEENQIQLAELPEHIQAEIKSLFAEYNKNQTYSKNQNYSNLEQNSTKTDLTAEQVELKESILALTPKNPNKENILLTGSENLNLALNSENTSKEENMLNINRKRLLNQQKQLS